VLIRIGFDSFHDPRGEFGIHNSFLFINVRLDLRGVAVVEAAGEAIPVPFFSRSGGTTR
jgi:hypothetical protein